MERDFMGLSKMMDESSEEPIDAVPVRSSLTMQWPPPLNKNHQQPSTTVVPQQFMSFQGKQPRTGFEALASNGLVSITTSDSFDGNRKPRSDFLQQGVHKQNVAVLPEKNLGGVSYSIHQKAMISLPFGQNLIGSMNSKPLTVTSTSHSNSPVVGSTELRNSFKVSNRPAQLTIFYNGSVSVYDHVSPEKAQAIMLLAGNGPSSAPSAKNPIVNPIQTIPPKPSVIEGFALNQTQVTTTATTPRWPSPSPITTISTISSGNNNNVGTTVKLGGILVRPHKAEPLKAVVSHPPRTPSSAPIFSSADTVPQFRKKSLARFLEKRKERVVSSAPYGTKQPTPNSSDSSSIPPII